MPRQNRHTRHPEADTRPVTIERSDAIDGAGALLALARANEREAAYIHGYSVAQSARRRTLTEGAQVYRSAAARLQDVADATHGAETTTYSVTVNTATGDVTAIGNGHQVMSNTGDEPAELAQNAADALRQIMPED